MAVTELATSRLARTFVELGHPQPCGFEVAALEAFARAQGRSDWTPSKLEWGDFYSVLELGTLAAILSGVGSSTRKLGTAVRATAVKGHPEASLLAELHAAALLHHLGFQPEFIGERKIRTPDMRALIDGAPVDVEVAFGQVKRSHEDLKLTLRNLTDDIPLRSGHAVHVWLHGEIDDAARHVAAQAAADCPMGATVEVTEQWSVTAGRFDPVNASNGVEPPPWWEGPSFFSTAVSLAGEDQMGSRVIVQSLAPSVSYFNPVRRKLGHMQRTGEHSFLLAFDIGRLPNALVSLQDELTAVFAGDARISGVLLFYSFFAWGGQVEWRAALVCNPGAEHPLPERMVAAVSPEMTAYRLQTLEAS